MDEHDNFLNNHAPQLVERLRSDALRQGSGAQILQAYYNQLHAPLTTDRWAAPIAVQHMERHYHELQAETGLLSELADYDDQYYIHRLKRRDHDAGDRVWNLEKPIISLTLARRDFRAHMTRLMDALEMRQLIAMHGMPTDETPSVAQWTDNPRLQRDFRTLSHECSNPKEMGLLVDSVSNDLKLLKLNSESLLFELGTEKNIPSMNDATMFDIASTRGFLRKLVPYTHEGLKNMVQMLDGIKTDIAQNKTMDDRFGFARVTETKAAAADTSRYREIRGADGIIDIGQAREIFQARRQR